MEDVNNILYFRDDHNRPLRVVRDEMTGAISVQIFDTQNRYWVTCDKAKLSSNIAGMEVSRYGFMDNKMRAKACPLYRNGHD